MAINNNRPTSPHLQVYKLPITGIISISHRMTGVMLSLGLLFFVYIVSALAGGAEAYSDMQNIMGLLAGAGNLLGIYLRAVFPFMPWRSAFDLGCRKGF